MSSKQNKVVLKQSLLKLINENLWKVNATTDRKLFALGKKIMRNANCNSNHESSPTNPSFDNITSTSETAFQRAIYRSNHSTLAFKNNKKEIEWLDLELPVTLTNKARRPCIDLVGFIEDTPIICELKFLEKKSIGDHPVYAIAEVLTYYYFVLCNHERLDKRNIHHLGTKPFKWGDIINPDTALLIVAANESYWNYWLTKRVDNELTKKLIRDALSLSKSINISINLFSTPDTDFTSQKGSDEQYEPKITTRETWQSLPY